MLALALPLAAGLGTAQTLRTAAAASGCPVASEDVRAPRPRDARPIPDSRIVRGERGIGWAWLGSPTNRYGHAALGSNVHASSLHAVVATPAGDREVVLRLPPDRVFEDRLVRLADLDGDGRDEVVVVEAQQQLGAALVVFGLAGPPAAPQLVERARSEPAGPMRWLNPVGVADFDGDGRAEVASVTTPHIGGVLTLYRYEPPRLVPLAREHDVANHRMGDVEQSLSAVLARPGKAPAVLVPDQSLRALRLFAWNEDGTWKQIAEPLPLASPVRRILPAADGACVKLGDGSWLLVSH